MSIIDNFDEIAAAFGWDRVNHDAMAARCAALFPADYLAKTKEETTMEPNRYNPPNPYDAARVREIIAKSSRRRDE